MRPFTILLAAVVVLAAAYAAIETSSRIREREDVVYYAIYREPCGQSLLQISLLPEGPFETVAPTGPADPALVLRRPLLSQQFRVRGHKSGKTRGDCDESVPEFVVEELLAVPPVVRPFDPDGVDLSNDLFAYTEELPKDRFVPEDFYQGTRFLDPASCVKKGEGACGTGKVAQTATTEGSPVYCCALLPAL